VRLIFVGGKLERSHHILLCDKLLGWRNGAWQRILKDGLLGRSICSIVHNSGSFDFSPTNSESSFAELNERPKSRLYRKNLVVDVNDT